MKPKCGCGAGIEVYSRGAAASCGACSDVELATEGVGCQRCTGQAAENATMWQVPGLASSHENGKLPGVQLNTNK